MDTFFRVVEQESVCTEGYLMYPAQNGSCLTANWVPQRRRRAVLRRVHRQWARLKSTMMLLSPNLPDVFFPSAIQPLGGTPGQW